MMMVAGLLSSCATPIADFRYYGHNKNTGDWIGDNFLTSDPETLSPQGWIERMNALEAKGLVVECTTSDTVANFKKELEKLCTTGHCTYGQKKALSEAFERLEDTGK